MSGLSSSTWAKRPPTSPRYGSCSRPHPTLVPALWPTKLPPCPGLPLAELLPSTPPVRLLRLTNFTCPEHSAPSRLPPGSLPTSWVPLWHLTGAIALNSTFHFPPRLEAPWRYSNVTAFNPGNSCRARLSCLPWTFEVGTGAAQVWQLVRAKPGHILASNVLQHDAFLSPC